MKPFFVGALGALVAVACGDSSGPGKRASSVTGIAGDNQIEATRHPLEFPLSLTVLGSGGEPIEGVSVTWTVTPASGATFAPQRSVSDVNGNVTTNVTLGSLEGDIVMQANVPGVSPPILYHATAVDPCELLRAYAVGQTVQGNLTATDCQGGPFYYDLYDLNLAASQSLRISMRWSGPPSSDTLDPYVELYRLSDGFRVAFDDDSILVEHQNSQLDIIVPADRYFIGATSFDAFDTGPFTLTSAVRQPELSGCRQVWMLLGTTVADSVTTTDCADSMASPSYYDVVRLLLRAGTVVKLAQRSAAMNPKMSLYQLDCDRYTRTLVAFNDDSTGTDAVITYTVPGTPPVSCYDVLLSTSGAGESGAYTFEVSASTTPSPRLSQTIPRRDGRESWWRNLLLPRPSKQ